HVMRTSASSSSPVCLSRILPSEARTSATYSLPGFQPPPIRKLTASEDSRKVEDRTSPVASSPRAMYPDRKAVPCWLNGPPQYVVASEAMNVSPRTTVQPVRSPVSKSGFWGAVAAAYDGGA